MSKKVLIVEDEAGIANAFKKQLTLIANFEVEWVHDGNSALAYLEKNKVDVILLDLVMPNVDGLEVLRQLKKNPRKYNLAPVFVLTNVSSEITEKEAKDLGATDYILKTTIDPDSLIAKINGVAMPKS